MFSYENSFKAEIIFPFVVFSPGTLTVLHRIRSLAASDPALSILYGNVAQRTRLHRENVTELISNPIPIYYSILCISLQIRQFLMFKKTFFYPLRYYFRSNNFDGDSELEQVLVNHIVRTH